MKNIIFPCVGRNLINNTPRWLLKINEKENLLAYNINTLDISNYDRVIVTILKEDLNLIDINELANSFSEQIEFCILDELTNGPAETIAQTITKMNVQGSLDIKDIDVVFNKPNTIHGNYITGVHLSNYESNVKELKNKSFITRNEQNVVIDIIEKNIKSDIISIGLYGFEDCNDFMTSYNIISKEFDKCDKIYVSHIISYLIGVEKKVFDFIEIDKYKSIKNEFEYNKFIKLNGTYIIDLNNIDILEIINYLKELYDLGAKLLFINKSHQDLSPLDNNDITYQTIDIESTKYTKLVKSENELKELVINAKE